MLAAIEYLSLSVGGLLLIISLTGLFASCYQAGGLLSTQHGDENIFVHQNKSSFITSKWFINKDNIFKFLKARPAQVMRG